MCGINGIVDLGPSGMQEAARGALLERMNSAIAHRGPDAEGLLVKPSMGFGFRRLSILDLSPSGNQPMWDTSGKVVLVFNGEIYNYIELRESLTRKGYAFRSGSDSEVLLNSYLEYGEKCVESFNGMWAFAIFDFRTNLLFCSRDRFGVKPFYYRVQDRQVYFSSELKALHAVCGLRRANRRKVFRYLAYGFRLNDGETFLEGCSELLPGTNLFCRDGQITFKKYWSLQENRFTHRRNTTCFEEYGSLFKDAVKIRFRSDVPVALLLSGGLDSTSIARVADQFAAQGALGQHRVHAYVASFPGFIYDETERVRRFISTCPHISLHEMTIDSRQITAGLENTLYSLDHPLGSFAGIAHNRIMKRCREDGVKVVLNGQGSDEALAGYDRYIAGAHLLDQWLSGNGRFRKEFRALNQHNGFSKIFLLAQMVKSMLSKPLSAFLRAAFQERSLGCLDGGFIRDNLGHFDFEYQFTFKGKNLTRYLLNAINYQDLNMILHYEDISSMQQSVEVRSPFMDYRIMEFAFSIPNELKFHQGVTKRIHRETIGNMLPDFITGNRQKIGFATPFDDYLISDPPFREYVFDVLQSSSFRSRTIWNPRKVLRRFETPQRTPQFPFWRFLNLEIWSNAYGIQNL